MCLGIVQVTRGAELRAAAVRILLVCRTSRPLAPRLGTFVAALAHELGSGHELERAVVDRRGGR